MAIEYGFWPQPSSTSKDGKKRLFPRVISKGTITVDDVIDLLIPEAGKMDIHSWFTLSKWGGRK